jgi:hypothetical protein
MSRTRRKRRDPISERHRRDLTLGVVLGVLIVVDIFLVWHALNPS